MPWSHVQDAPLATTAAIAAGGLVATFPAAITVGNVIVVMATWGDVTADVSAVTAGSGAVATSTSPAVAAAADGGGGRMYFITGTPAAQTTITLTLTNTGGTASIWALEFAPPSGTVSLDGHSETTSAYVVGGTNSGTAITPATANDLLISGYIDGVGAGTATAPVAPWTVSFDNGNVTDGVAWEILSGNPSSNVGWKISNTVAVTANAVVFLAALQAVAASSFPPVPAVWHNPLIPQ